jgi:perosamine synthetase
MASTIIPMSEPDITEKELTAVQEVLRTPTLALGPRLTRFEHDLATYVGARHGIGVSSGTAGLHLCMLAAGVQKDDLVLTTPFSFVASANCILYVGARPIFVDVDPVALTIDPEALDWTVHNLVRSGEGGGGRLKAILPVHVFGQPADMDPILEIARARGLAVIEDACEAIGATYRGRPVGTLGDAGVFAFYPNKQMTTGEGGMIVTGNAAWDALFRSLRNQGRDTFDGWLAHSRLGYNYRLDELSAALGAVQVARLDEILAKRARVAAWYREHLQRLEGIELPTAAPWTTRMSWFVYVVRLTGAGGSVAPEPARAGQNRDDLVRELERRGGERDRVIAELERRGIPARPYFPPIHLQPFYREMFGFAPGAFPITEAAGATCLALPFFGTMREEQVATVCGALEESLRACRASRSVEGAVTRLPASVAAGRSSPDTGKRAVGGSR